MAYSRRHAGIRRAQILELDKAYNELLKEVSEIYASRRYDTDRVFRFNNQPSYIKERTTRVFNEYRKKVEQIIRVSQKEGWNEATEAFKVERLKRIEKLKSHLTTQQYNNQLAVIESIKSDISQLTAFANRSVGQVNLSRRVWDISHLAKENIEDALTDALGKGKSAQELARSIKRNLNNPDALFRRIRDKHGRLAPSRPMKAYKPGRGVYRSAHKNAMRLARTEINSAYARSEQVSMLRNNDIVAQKITTSHAHKVEDICDILAGEYPKDFMWEGWHPQCMCVRTFVQKTDEEFIRDIKEGKNTPSEKSVNFVKDVPPQFKRWLAQNRERIQGWSSKPTFLENNGY